MKATTTVATRRTFLASAGIAAAHVWVPTPVTGYSHAEIAAMDEPMGSFGRR